LKSYKEACVLPLNDNRKLALSKYVVRSLSVQNSLFEELFIDSEIDYPKRAKTLMYLQTIRNYTKSTLAGCKIDITTISPIPYSSLNKEENLFCLLLETKEHLQREYSSYLQIFTDGSVLETGHAGSGLIIPDLGISKSYYIGENISIFTAELFAMSVSLYNVLICVDSKSVLQSLKNVTCNKRTDLLYEILAQIHILRIRA
jgi:hypothetical protein